MKTGIITSLFYILLLSCGRTTKYPSDKTTKYIFINKTPQGANLIGLYSKTVVKDIFVKDSGTSEFEVTTPKTFFTAGSFFNDPDSVIIRFENGKTTIFSLNNIDFFHKSPVDPNAYTYNKINENYLEKSYFITQELLDSAR